MRATLPCMTFFGNSKIYSVVDALRDIDRFLCCTMCSSPASTSQAWISDNFSDAITVSTNLLNHERTLSNGLKTLATATTTCWSRSTRFRSCTFTCGTNICSSKAYRLLSTIDSIHKINLLVYHDVLTLRLSFTFPTTFLASEHLLKLIENVAKWTGTRTLRSPELIREAFEPGEPLSTATERTSGSKWTLPSKRILSLLVSRHSSLVVDATLIIIIQSLVRIIDFTKLLFSFCTGVHIWMILLSQLEVCLFDVWSACIPIQIEKLIKIFVVRWCVIITSTTAASAPRKFSPLREWNEQWWLLKSRQSLVCEFSSGGHFVAQIEKASSLLLVQGTCCWLLQQAERFVDKPLILS